jgi:chromosome segregation protein
VIGPLLGRLRFAPENEDLVRGLVGDAILVETIAAARDLAARHPGRPLVTLDGAVLAAGRVVGGAADAVAAGMLEQHREMRELTEYVQRETSVVEEQTARSQALKQRITDLGLALDRARQDAHQSEIAHVTAEKDLRRAEEQVMASERRLSAITADLRDIEDQLAEAIDEQSDARTALEEAREQIEGSSRELQDAEALVEGWRERVMAQQAAVTEQKVRVARLREQTSGLRATVERLSRSVDDLMGRIRRLADELLDGARQAGRAAGALFASKERLGDAVRAAQDADRELSGARRLFDEARAELGEREQGLRELRTRVARLTEGRTKHQFELERIVVATTHLLEGVREKFRGLDLRRVIGDYHARPLVDDAHRGRITELGQLIDRMGPVNLDAVREYEEADKRFVFYTTQRADLEGALADLVKAIDQIDKQSRKLFRETFDSVNAKFQLLFPRMFRGGEARLQLTGADDLLEAGVEILAQPPGKRLVNIELMSGGEKALTAVSLIFAMFQHKPSPFCVLDEVDAPLDEANVARYNEAIRTMTDQSQFILITHIKRTMQSVDALYGVTMQEPGVSRLVSVKVHDSAAKQAKPAAVA